MTYIRNNDLFALKSYVTAIDNKIYSDLNEETIILDLTHSNLKQRFIEIRFNLHDNLYFLRSKIYQKTGTPPDAQHLVFIFDRVTLMEIPPKLDNDRMLGYYSLHNGTIVHCIDIDPFSGSRDGGYEDITLVKKYIMEEKEYDKRIGTLRSWIREKINTDPNFTLVKHAKEHREFMQENLHDKVPPMGLSTKEIIKKKKIEIKFGPKSVNGIEMGMRCEVSPGKRRGTIAYVGTVPELCPGQWVGIVFDEPVGMNDGTARGGKRYFYAKGPKYGGFVRAKHLEVGNFPERGLFVDSDSLEDEI